MLNLKKPDVYRSKIKGFHSAFNVKDKIVYDNELKAKFNADKTGNRTAKELLNNAEQLKAQRLKNMEIKQRLQVERQKIDRDHHEEVHRLIRKKNRDELKSFINENRDVSHRFGKYKTLKEKYEHLEK